MRKEQKFFICKHCGNIIQTIRPSGVNVVCCNDQMTELVPNKTDAATEKHVPVVEVNGNMITVKVGSVPHPMVEEHYIEWIYLKTTSGGQMKFLTPGISPEAVFSVTDDDTVVAAYEYCNLHGLWIKEL